MKNIFSFIAIAVLCIALSGCPYQSSTPIDAPTIKVDTRLIGTWKSSGSDDDKYKISQADEFTYSFIKHSKGSEDEKYLGYFSVVNDVTFLNLYNDTGSDIASRLYNLYRVDVKGDGVIILKEMTENIDEEFTTSEELKKFIASNMNNSYFYSKDETIYSKQ